MTTQPSPYSSGNPRLQVAWDSTSLRALMTCPRYYQLTSLEGWGGSNTDLEFGILFASSAEVFKKAVLAGKSMEDAELEAVGYALNNSGYYLTNTDNDRWVPWGGEYRDQWRCTGTEKYKNAKGNPAKCPYSHKGVWIDGEAPGICSCGSPIEVQNNWASIDPNKDRYTLLRLVCWYCEEQLDGDQGVQPYSFPDGTPAVELSFRLPLPSKTPSGENYLLCGHLDSIVRHGMEEVFLADNKTTKKPLSKAWKEQFSPNIQVEVYDLAGSILFPDLNLKGVLIEGAQTLQSGARFGLHTIRRNEAQREETLTEVLWWIKRAEQMAEDGYWPRNHASCWGCAFKSICRMDAPSREMYLKSEFTKRDPWNPLAER